jgi:hypothetical protein
MGLGCHLSEDNKGPVNLLYTPTHPRPIKLHLVYQVTNPLHFLQFHLQWDSHLAEKETETQEVK